MWEGETEGDWGRERDRVGNVEGEGEREWKREREQKTER